MSKKNLDIHARRSGKVPGVFVGIASAVFVTWDSGHWHVVHHMFGKYSPLIAFALVVAVIILTVALCRRPAGRVSIDRE